MVRSARAPTVALAAARVVTAGPSAAQGARCDNSGGGRLAGTFRQCGGDGRFVVSAPARPT